MRRALLFGASGQIGAPLLLKLHNAGWHVTAVSRQERNDEPGVHWLRGGFDGLAGLPREVNAIFSCGPLDRFGHWLAAAAVGYECVVAFGSTSAEVKQGSDDAHERDVAQRLRMGEGRVLDAAAAHGAQAALLRPTLVYGAGRDHTLSRIAGMARRWKRFVLPRRADGLRQPVHVDDLADAAFAAATAIHRGRAAYDLPGGETLPYRAMVARVLACLEPPVPLVELPAPLFRAALAAAQARGIATGLGMAAVERMRHDLVFDLEPARRDLGYAPRAFRPTPAMFDRG